MTDLRDIIRRHTLTPEGPLLADLIAQTDLSPAECRAISARAAQLIRSIRDTGSASMMEIFLEEYGLSSQEGIALMCLAEALLRVPDAETIDALIEDKIAPSDWGRHIGASSSPLVNASTWALMLTGKVLDDRPPGLIGSLKAAVKRLGEPVIRTAVSRAMREMGRQFVLGRDIGEAMDRAAGMEAKGFTYSYDMLGEAARTDADARRYHLSYSRAISAIATKATEADITRNPGISIKLSALHPRYEYARKDQVMRDLVPRARALCVLAKSAGMGLNIDAEEADRLDLSLDIIDALLGDEALAGWNGFGVVVQAYARRAVPVIDWLCRTARSRNRRIMVRLVKGAYWDTEIKRAQVLGLDDFPVFTRKCATDVSYIACARRLLASTDVVYPQFATHNAHTIAAIVHMGADPSAFEFQRLHGMGETLHTLVLTQQQTRCRIYAPVGAHKDLLAYLVRRLLENGANSSFVHQIVDPEIAPEVIAADPVAAAQASVSDAHNPALRQPRNLYPDRRNARGWDIFDPAGVTPLLKARDAFATCQWRAHPILAGQPRSGRDPDPLPAGGDRSPGSGPRQAAPAEPVINPATGAVVGQVVDATDADARHALAQARIWGNPARGDVLRRAADLYETHAPELLALLAREAGKTLPDAVSELREAVDFLRYYATRIATLDRPPCGTAAAISPWNFPLAIFTGQIAGALAAGNAVLAKPAETTPLVACRAVGLLHEAGVPRSALQFLPGDGRRVGATLAGQSDLTVFTGSTATARAIHRTMAETAPPFAPLIAETGGINAMIVDSTALPEQAVRDIVASAFQSAGQRCSALRVLYVQTDIADALTMMLFGAMDMLTLGDPWALATDIGPVIDAAAQAGITAYVSAAKAQGRVLKTLATPDQGTFVAPTVIACTGINDLDREIFGPILHLATFEPEDLPDILADINGSGHGLTFGVHSRIDDRVAEITSQLHVGNAYVNRNQIGAVVGSQPFGGEGLSGTGPKAGGPAYVARMTRHITMPVACAPIDAPDLQSRINAAAAPDLPKRAPMAMPGPTGEKNLLSRHPRGLILCLGADAAAHAANAMAQGCPTVAIPGAVTPDVLSNVTGIAAVVFDGPEATARLYRKALADRTGPIIPLWPRSDDPALFGVERHLCIDTTASGGNAELLAAMDPVPAGGGHG